MENLNTLGSLVMHANPLPRIRGAKGQQYQLMADLIELSDVGNGWDEPQIVFALELRRSLDGTHEAVVRMDYCYKKNNIHFKRFYDYSEIFECTGFEEVTEVLSTPATVVEYVDVPDLCKPPLHSGWHDSLKQALAGFGFGR